MKRVLGLTLSILLLPSLGVAQAPPFQVAYPAGTPVYSGTPGVPSSAVTDRYGVQSVAVTGSGGTGETQSVIPVSNAADLNGPLSSINGYFNVGTDTIEAASTTTVLNLTGHAARVGDLIIPTGGTAANVDVAIPVCSVTANSVTLCYALPATPSTDAITIRRPAPLFTPKEDSAHVSGDSGLPALGVINVNAAAVGADLDYSPISTTLTGAAFANIDRFYQRNEASGILKAEDAAASSGDALVGVAGIVDNAVTAGKAASGDYTGIAVSDAGSVVSALVLDPAVTFAKQAVKAEDAVASSGDALVGVAAVRNDDRASIFCTTNGDYCPFGVDASGGLYLGFGTFGPMVAEDALAASGDGLVKTAAVANEAQSNLSGTDGDYTPFATTRNGSQYTVMNRGAQPTDANYLLKGEDNVAAGGDAGVVSLAVVESALSVDAAANDYGTLKTDEVGRTITTLAPAGESWQACSTAVTGTGDQTIKSNVASNKIYVTSVTCHNNSAVASILTLKSAATAIYSSYLGPNTISSNVWNQTFPVPLRLSTNEALNFAMTTTSTSTICCASGYISVN